MRIGKKIGLGRGGGAKTMFSSHQKQGRFRNQPREPVPSFPGFDRKHKCEIVKDLYGIC